jgi:hypothetical protein
LGKTPSIIPPDNTSSPEHKQRILVSFDFNKWAAFDLPAFCNPSDKLGIHYNPFFCAHRLFGAQCGYYELIGVRGYNINRMALLTGSCGLLRRFKMYALNSIATTRLGGHAAS